MDRFNDVPQILTDSNLRANKMHEFVRYICVNGTPSTFQAVATYGEYVERGEEQPRDITIDFYRALLQECTPPGYLETTKPMKAFSRQLKSFEEELALKVYRSVIAFTPGSSPKPEES